MPPEPVGSEGSPAKIVSTQVEVSWFQAVAALCPPAAKLPAEPTMTVVMGLVKLVLDQLEVAWFQARKALLPRMAKLPPEPTRPMASDKLVLVQPEVSWFQALAASLPEQREVASGTHDVRGALEAGYGRARPARSVVVPGRGAAIAAENKIAS